MSKIKKNLKNQNPITEEANEGSIASDSSFGPYHKDLSVLTMDYIISVLNDNGLTIPPNILNVFKMARYSIYNHHTSKPCVIKRNGKDEYKLLKSSRDAVNQLFLLAQCRGDQSADFVPFNYIKESILFLNSTGLYKKIEKIVGFEFFNLVMSSIEASQSRSQLMRRFEDFKYDYPQYKISYYSAANGSSDLSDSLFKDISSDTKNNPKSFIDNFIRSCETNAQNTIIKIILVNSDIEISKEAESNYRRHSDYGVKIANSQGQPLLEHLEFVSDRSIKNSKNFKLSSDETLALELAATLHDIGKVHGDFQDYIFEANQKFKTEDIKDKSVDSDVDFKEVLLGLNKLRESGAIADQKEETKRSYYQQKFANLVLINKDVPLVGINAVASFGKTDIQFRIASNFESVKKIVIVCPTINVAINQYKDLGEKVSRGDFGNISLEVANSMLKEQTSFSDGVVRVKSNLYDEEGSKEEYCEYSSSVIISTIDNLLSSNARHGKLPVMYDLLINSIFIYDESHEIDRIYGAWYPYVELILINERRMTPVPVVNLTGTSNDFFFYKILNLGNRYIRFLSPEDNGILEANDRRSGNFTSIHSYKEIFSYLEKILEYRDRKTLETQKTFHRSFAPKLENLDENMPPSQEFYLSNDNVKTLICSNSISVAQKFSILDEATRPGSTLCVHSRYNKIDKKRILESLLSNFAKNASSDLLRVRSSKSIEISLDVGFDRIIMDARPAESFIQVLARGPRWSECSNYDLRIYFPAGGNGFNERDPSRKTLDAIYGREEELETKDGKVSVGIYCYWKKYLKELASSTFTMVDLYTAYFTYHSDIIYDDKKTKNIILANYSQMMSNASIKAETATNSSFSNMSSISGRSNGIRDINSVNVITRDAIDSIRSLTSNKKNIKENFANSIISIPVFISKTGIEPVSPYDDDLKKAFVNSKNEIVETDFPNKIGWILNNSFKNSYQKAKMAFEAVARAGQAVILDGYSYNKDIGLVLGDITSFVSSGDTDTLTEEEGL